MTAKMYLFLGPGTQSPVLYTLKERQAGLQRQVGDLGVFEGLQQRWLHFTSHILVQQDVDLGS